MSFLSVIFFIASIPLILRFIYIKLIACKCHSKNRLDGKLAIVTGASAGIGLETAADLAARGARVVLACRNVPKALAVAQQIIQRTGNKNVEVKKLDVASLASVRAFAKDILATEPQLHILVNNAGISGTGEKVTTRDGLELTFASNHYGHFLLTNMLGGLLKAGAPSRVVCVSSYGHVFCSKLNPSDLSFNKEKFTISKAYYRSKLCNVLMARELATRLRGTGVTSYSVDPGITGTRIFFKDTPFVVHVFGFLCSIVAKSAELGAQTSIYCAVSDEVVGQSGKFFMECREISSSKLGTDDVLAKEVWAASAADVGLQPHEANI